MPICWKVSVTGHGPNILVVIQSSNILVQRKQTSNWDVHFWLPYHNTLQQLRCSLVMLSPAAPAACWLGYSFHGGMSLVGGSKSHLLQYNPGTEPQPLVSKSSLCCWMQQRREIDSTLISSSNPKGLCQKQQVISSSPALSSAQKEQYYKETEISSLMLFFFFFFFTLHCFSVHKNCELR